MYDSKLTEYFILGCTSVLYSASLVPETGSGGENQGLEEIRQRNVVALFEANVKTIYLLATLRLGER